MTYKQKVVYCPLVLGASGRVKCMEDGCAWWITEGLGHNGCAIKKIAASLK